MKLNLLNDSWVCFESSIDEIYKAIIAVDLREDYEYRSYLKIEKYLDEGSFGRVYKCLRIKGEFRQVVAVKTLKKSELTQKEIGRRISEIRKSKGYSQDDLAKLLNISRPSLTQIELGKRNLKRLLLN